MKIITAEKLTDLRHLNLFSIHYQDRLNQDRTWYLASRLEQPRCISRQFSVPDGVIIVPFHTENRRIVVIREYRVVLGDYKYGFPAGLVDPGETIAETARRELKEETGLDITRIREIGPPVYSSTGMTDESVAMVYADCAGEASNVDNSSSEDIETLFLTQTEARELYSRGDVKFDAKAWLVLKSFAETGGI